MTLRATAALLALLAAGCPSPGTYGTPRTIEPGTVSHTVSLDVVGVAGAKGGDAAPPVPSYTARIGLANRLDLGVRAAGFTSAATDLKWNFVRTRVFDVAIDPGSQWLYDRANDVHYFYLNAPLMLGFNLRDDLTLVFVPAFALQATTRDTLAPCPVPLPPATQQTPPCGSEVTRWLGPTAPIVRAGLGLSWRMFRDFAVQPEVTVSRQLGGWDGWIVTGGLGVSFLNLPRYDDFVEEEGGN